MRLHVAMFVSLQQVFWLHLQVSLRLFRPLLGALSISLAVRRTEEEERSLDGRNQIKLNLI